MLIKTRGIVFKSVKYGETSLILDIYTEEVGLRTYIASGVRKPKARLSASLLQLMSLVNVVAYERSGHNMTRLKEVRAAYPYQTIPFYFPKSAVGQFMVEVARKSIREREANTSLFTYLFDSFTFLDGYKQSIANFPLFFLVHLTPFLGFKPGDYDPSTPYFDLREGVYKPKQVEDSLFSFSKPCSQALSQLQSIGRDKIHKIRVTAEIRQELMGKLLDYYRYHLEHFPKIRSRDILKEVLAAGPK